MLTGRTYLFSILTVVLAASLIFSSMAHNLDEPQDLISPTNYSEIEKGLFMGGLIPKAPPRVIAVLNLSEFEDEYRAKYHTTMTIPDSEPAPNLKWLQKAVGFVEEHHSKGRATYVHCFAGISRSGMVVTAHLMKKNGWTRDEALAYVRKARPAANPNPAFMERLAEWEKALAPKR